MISVVPGGIGWGPFDRHSLFARRQEALVVNLGHLRQPRQAERFDDLADGPSQMIAIIGADTVLARRRRHDLMAAEPRQSLALDVELGEIVMLAERLHRCFRIGDRIAPAARRSADESFDRVGIRLQESRIRQEGIAIHVKTIVGVIDDGDVVDCNAVGF
jgi:hypothetical protein